MSIQAKFKSQFGNFALEVDFEIPSPGVTAIFGRSGSGKTTFLRCVAGLERPTHGRLWVDGEVWQDDAAGVFMPSHRRAVGYVFQEVSLFSHLNVLENLKFGFDRVPADRRTVQFGHVVDLLGLGPFLNRGSSGLSGGERQRVGIGRAILSSPRLLLLDEPLSSLDAQSRNEILPYLESLRHDLRIPILYVTHAVEEVRRLADHVVAFEGGRVRAQDRSSIISQWDGNRSIAGSRCIRITEVADMACANKRVTFVRGGKTGTMVLSEEDARIFGFRVGAELDVRSGDED